MQIYVRPEGYLSQYIEMKKPPEEDGWLMVKVESGWVEAILEACGIPADEVCFLVRNGEAMHWDDPVQEGDRIALIPPIEGG